MRDLIGPIINALAAALVMRVVPADYITTTLVVVCYAIGYVDGRIKEN